MQAKWIALGLYRRRLVLILVAGVPQLKHIALGSRTRVTQPTERPWQPRFLRRALGTMTMYVVGIP